MSESERALINETIMKNQLMYERKVIHKPIAIVKMEVDEVLPECINNDPLIIPTDAEKVQISRDTEQVDLVPFVKQEPLSPSQLQSNIDTDHNDSDTEVETETTSSKSKVYTKKRCIFDFTESDSNNEAQGRADTKKRRLSKSRLSTAPGSRLLPINDNERQGDINSNVGQDPAKETFEPTTTNAAIKKVVPEVEPMLVASNKNNDPLPLTPTGDLRSNQNSLEDTTPGMPRAQPTREPAKNPTSVVNASPSPSKIMKSMEKAVSNLSFVACRIGIDYICNPENCNLRVKCDQLFQYHIKTRHLLVEWTGHCKSCNKIVAKPGSLIDEFNHMHSQHVLRDGIAPSLPEADTINALTGELRKKQVTRNKAQFNLPTTNKRDPRLRISNLVLSSVGSNPKPSNYKNVGQSCSKILFTVPGPSTSAASSTIVAQKPSTSSATSSVATSRPSTSAASSSVVTQKPSTSAATSSIVAQRPSTSSATSSVAAPRPSTSSAGSSKALPGKSYPVKNLSIPIQLNPQLPLDSNNQKSFDKTNPTTLQATVKPFDNKPQCSKTKAFSTDKRASVHHNDPLMEHKIPALLEQNQNSSLNTKRLQPWLEANDFKHALNVAKMLKEECLVDLFKCMDENCDFHTKNFESFKSHLLIHESRKSQESQLYGNCSYCSFLTAEASSLLNHINACHKFDRYACTKCFYRSVVELNIINHMKKFHKKDPKVVLDCEAEKIDANQAEREASKSRKNFVKPICCVCCKERFFSFEMFILHYRKQHPNEVFKGKCKICQGETDLGNLRQHLENCHQINNFNCVYCRWGSKDIAEVKIHLMNAHPNKLPFYGERLSVTSQSSIESVVPLRLFTEIEQANLPSKRIVLD